jgi:hypothetical protein
VYGAASLYITPPRSHTTEAEHHQGGEGVDRAEIILESLLKMLLTAAKEIPVAKIVVRRQQFVSTHQPRTLAS